MKEFNIKAQELTDKGKTKSINKLEPNYHFTKLRYDGSYELSERNDYRDAFSHCIADGTKHFSSKVTKEVFDNLSFISKKEVGREKKCANPCDIDVISHAGAEIVDFAALYIGRDIFKEFYRDYEIRVNGKDPAEVDDALEKKCAIIIPGQTKIDPVPVLHRKLFESADVAKHKKIEDYPY